MFEGSLLSTCLLGSKEEKLNQEKVQQNCIQLIFGKEELTIFKVVLL